jgi:histone demethylase JARID1
MSATPDETPNPEDSTAAPDDVVDAEASTLRSPSALFALLDEVDKLPFDAPEIAQLRGVVDQVTDLRARAQEYLRAYRGEDIPYQPRFEGEPTAEDCQWLVDSGAALNIALPELDALSQLVKRRKWRIEMHEIQDNFINYSDVCDLLREAEEAGVSPNDLLYHNLLERRANGDEWIMTAKLWVEGHDAPTALDLETLTSTPNNVAIVPALHHRAEVLLQKSRECQRSVDAIYAGMSEPLEGHPVPTGNLTQLPDARRVLRTIKQHNLHIAGAPELVQGIELYDEWTGMLHGALTRSFSRGKVMNAATIEAEVQRFYERVIGTTNTADEQSSTTRFKCICRSEEMPPASMVCCSRCRVEYHLACMGLEARDVPKTKPWNCPICAGKTLQKFMQRRDALDMSLLEELSLSPKFAPHHFQFPPPELELVHDMHKRLQRFRDVTSRALGGSVMDIAHALRRSLGLPVNVATPNGDCTLTLAFKRELQGLRNSTTQLLDPEAVMAPDQAPAKHPSPAKSGHARGGSRAAHPIAASESGSARAGPSASPAKGDVTLDNSFQDVDDGDKEVDGRKRKRGKRAKLIFSEEMGVVQQTNGERVYCICKKPEFGHMIGCDRCLLWFHCTCVNIPKLDDLNRDDRWLCPLCCVKTEKKYAWAEVKVRPIDWSGPDMYLDVRATLRSTKKPVSKAQYWTSPESDRIVLHLESWHPAVLADRSELPAKRRRIHDANDPSTSGLRGEQQAEQYGRASASATPSAAAPPILPPLGPASGMAARSLPLPPGSHSGTPSNGGTTHPSPHVQSASAGSQAPQPRFNPPHEHGYGARGAPDPVERERAEREDAKRDAEQRHRAGMANLYSRGVTDAMIERWYVGWNGRTLVWPRYDEHGKFIELDLGKSIRLAPGDVDGSRYIQMVLDKENARKAEEHRRRQMQQQEDPHRREHRERDLLHPRELAAPRPQLPPPPAPGALLPPPGLGAGHAGPPILPAPHTLALWPVGVRDQPLPPRAHWDNYPPERVAHEPSDAEPRVRGSSYAPSPASHVSAVLPWSTRMPF